MYSFGVVLWELVTHDTPIRGRLYDPQARVNVLPYIEDVTPIASFAAVLYVPDGKSTPAAFRLM